MNKPITLKQKQTIIWLYKKLGYKHPQEKYLNKYNRNKASRLIEKLKTNYQASPDREEDLGIMKPRANTNSKTPKTILRKRL